MPELKVKIGGDATGFEAATQAALGSARKFRRNVNTTLAGTLGAAFTIAGIANKTREVVEYGSKIFDLSQKTGTSIKTLQEWGYAAQQNGAQIEDVSNAFRGLSKARREALENPTGDTAKAFAAVGIDDSALRNLSQSDLFRKIADTFNKVDFGADEEALADKMLGRGGTTLLATFKDDFASLIDEANRLGIVLDDGVVKKLDEAGDAAQRIAAAFRGPFANAVVYVIKLISAVISSLQSTFENIGLGISLITRNPFTQEGRDQIKDTIAEIKKVNAEAGKEWLKLFGVIPEEPVVKAEREQRNAAPEQKQEQEKELKTRTDREKPIGIESDAATRIGAFIGGATPGLGAAVFGNQPRMETKLTEISRNTAETARVLKQRSSPVNNEGSL